MMFTGTSQQQDTRFSDKEKKLLKQLRFGDCLNKRVDMSKVKLDCIRPWISKKITDFLHMEDDVVVEFVYNQLEEEKFPCPKKMQINMTGFLNGKNARQFMDELWALLLSAQESSTGIPKEFIDQKKEEILKREQQDAGTEPSRNDDSLASAVSREEAVMKQIEKIKESARIKDDLAQKTNSIVLAKADEISEKLNREKLKQLADVSEEKEAKDQPASEKDVPEKDASNNNAKSLKSKSPENRIKSRNYRGRSRNRSRSRDKSAEKSSRHDNSTKRSVRNRSRSPYDRPRRRSQSRSRDRKEPPGRRNESPRGRNRKDRSMSRNRRGRSRSRSPRNRTNKRDMNNSRRVGGGEGRRGEGAANNRSREVERRPRDRDRKLSRSVTPMDKTRKKNRSVSQEKRRPGVTDKPTESNRSNRRDRVDRESPVRQREETRRAPVEENTRGRRKQEDGKGSPKAETNGGGHRHRKLSVDNDDVEEEQQEDFDVAQPIKPTTRQSVERQDQSRIVHDSSISRTPSPFLSGAERNPQLMVGTLVEKLALKRKLRGMTVEDAHSSTDSEPPKRSKVVVEDLTNTSSSKKKLKKSKKKNKKSKKKSKAKKSKRDSSDSQDEVDPDDRSDQEVQSGSRQNRDALEKQLRERALKSMRKQLSE